MDKIAGRELKGEDYREERRGRIRKPGSINKAVTVVLDSEILQAVLYKMKLAKILHYFKNTY